VPALRSKKPIPVREFPIPTSNSTPVGITAGPDGNLWFTEGGANKIGRITTTGVVTEFPVPTPKRQIIGITAGPAHTASVWFTEFIANQIGEISTK
jgi:virginiamycin B lyase